MSARVEVRDLGWTPVGAPRPALAGVDLRVEPGERVLLTGPSGCGKSTLLRLLAGVLGPDDGEMTGELRLDVPPPGLGHERAADLPVGLLLQDPRDARVAARVGRDVAFGPENAGLPRREIEARVAAALRAVGFPYGTRHPTSALSGGQAQRLALAGVVVTRPGLLLLDEPTSMLDDGAADHVRTAVLDALEGTDTSLVVVEHRLPGWVPLVDRVVVLGGAGGVVADGPADVVLRRHGALLTGEGVWVPDAPAPEPVPVPADLVTPRAPTRGDLVVARRVGLVRRPRARLFRGAPTPPVTALDGVDARVGAGEVLALRGNSGAGKSSLLDLLLGLAAPSAGAVVASAGFASGLKEAPHRWSSADLAARAAWVPQHAESTIVGATVRDCLHATGRALGRAGQTAPRADALGDLLGLSHLFDRNPHRLSGGETRRLALAGALAHGPGLLGLDEPTVGQDRHTWAAVAGLVGAAARAGTGVAVSTHDHALVALADATLTLDNGRVA